MLQLGVLCAFCVESCTVPSVNVFIETVCEWQCEVPFIFKYRFKVFLAVSDELLRNSSSMIIASQIQYEFDRILVVLLLD